MRLSFLPILSMIIAFFCAGCSELPFVTQHTAPTMVFLADYSTAWTAAMEALGTDVQKNNRDLGQIDTGWIENTERLHFLNVFSDEDFFLRARYRLQVQVHQGKKNEQNAVQIRVLKLQQMEKTFLSGWEDVESDGVDEATYLYRIGRLIAIQQYNEKQDEQQRNRDDKE